MSDLFHMTMGGTPPDGWSRGHVTLALVTGALAVEAWRRGAFAVHEFGAADRIIAILTHVPTGLRIWTFDSLFQATRCAEAIEGFTDWHAITQKVLVGDALHSEVWPEVVAVIDTIAGLAEQSGETAE